MKHVVTTLVCLVFSAGCNVAPKVDSEFTPLFNGQSITSADQALRLFTVFRNEREIVLDIERAGKEIQLSYTVQ